MQTMHLFAGIGGGLLADRILGHTPIVAVECDSYACQVLRERAADGWFPGLHVWEGDVRLFDPSKYAGRVGCIHAGFPCQDISVAGKQAGVGAETRSGLYREVLRIAGVVRPRFLFLENVAAIITNGLGTVLGDLAALGYDCEWLCLRASDCGAPHHRDRWWLLAKQSDVLSNSEHNGARRREQQSEGAEKKAGDVGDPLCDGLQRDAWCEAVIRTNAGKQSWSAAFGGIGQAWRYWTDKPGLGRVAYGVSNRMGQLKGYGNAQVPLQAAVAYRLLGGE